MGRVSRENLPESGRWKCANCLHSIATENGFGECHKMSPKTGKDGVALWPRILVGYHRCSDFEDVL